MQVLLVVLLVFVAVAGLMALRWTYIHAFRWNVLPFIANGIMAWVWLSAAIFLYWKVTDNSTSPRSEDDFLVYFLIMMMPVLAARFGWEAGRDARIEAVENKGREEDTELRKLW